MMGIGMAVRPPRQLSLMARALSAIRRNGGTLIGIPDNFAGTYIDSTGTQPVTAIGDLVGLLTDRSYGAGNLGVELVTNQTVAGLPAGGGTRFYNLTANLASTFVANKAYLVRYRVTNYTGTGNVGLAGAAPAGVVQQSHTANGEYQSIQLPTASGAPALFTTNTNTCNFVLLSVREVLGNHATQPTTASKPTVTRVPKRTKGPVNQLSWSGDFSNAVWSNFSPSFTRTLEATAGPNGDAAWRITATATPGVPIRDQVATATSVTLTVAYKAGTLNPNGWLVRNTTTSTNLTATITSVGLPNGWRLLSLVVTSGITIGNTLSLYFGATGGVAEGLYWFLHRGALFAGDYTAQQIIDNGGIPLTTTQPLPNVLEWTNAISFDGSNDFLQTGITTGNEGWVCAGVRHNSATTCYPVASGGLIDSMAGINLRLINGVTPQVLACDGTLRQVLQADANITQGDVFVNSCGWDSATLLLGVNNTEKSAARTRNPTASAITTIGAADGTGAGVVNGTLSAMVRCPVLPSASDRALIRKWVGSLQGQTL